ncbi:MAG: hypothetical protein IJ908_04740 [Fibrobacter sp.]|nr:hypothetical protein [Fibrobacter sp.]MBR6854404.1 hypothetical protein [Fibrobacter sp.]
MQNLKLKSICGVFAVLFCLGCLNTASAEERSMWQRFANFFTPTGSLKGEGPVFDKLKNVETQIDKIEVQYTRERRPGNKTRYRKQLDSLRNVRDSLITVIETKLSSSSMALSSSAQLVKTQSNAAISSAMVSSSSVVVSSANVACVHDTVFVHDTLVVRDTVVIHDTLYVVLANKPEPATPKENKNADKTSGK